MAGREAGLAAAAIGAAAVIVAALITSHYFGGGTFGPTTATGVGNSPSPVGTSSPVLTSPSTDACLQGYVWREVTPQDHVCVTPESRDVVKNENALASTRVDPNGGPSGPDTCLQGYVWRQATPGDDVCVEPSRRDDVAEENRLAPDHLA